MPIPSFDAFMLPLLQMAGDGKEHSLAEARQYLAREFQLTEEEQRELLPSGKQRRLDNRVAWAKVHLDKAGLLEKTRRGFFRITDAGREVLRQPPPRVDVKFLLRYDEFRRFYEGSGGERDDRKTDEETPQEVLERAHETIRKELAAELLSQVQAASPGFFEKLVLDLMVKMGYGGVDESGAQLTPGGADEGIDGIIHEDRLGLDVIYLQAKRWGRPVGRPELQKFVGALHGKRARKGVFLTTSEFTRDAVEYVKTIDPKVVLIDGERLASLMIDFNVGVTVSHSYEIKRVDSDYFDEG